MRAKVVLAAALILLLGVSGAMVLARNIDGVDPDPNQSFSHTEPILTSPPDPGPGFHYEIFLPYVIADLNPTKMGDIHETQGDIETYLHFSFPAFQFVDPATGLDKVLMPGSEVVEISIVADH